MAIDKVTKCIQMASISGVPVINGMFDFGSMVDDSSGVSTNSSGSYESGVINWNKVFGKLIDTGTKYIENKANTPSGGGGSFFPSLKPTTNGININTILLIAGAGLGLYFIIRKK
jgi:hypothetical protein